MLTKGDLAIIALLAFLGFGVAYWFMEEGLTIALFAALVGGVVGGIRVYLARRTFR